MFHESAEALCGPLVEVEEPPRREFRRTRLVLSMTGVPR
jgi:hypothetical protein